MWIRRGDVFWVNLNPTQGSEQAGHRPVLVIQNDVGNQVAPTTIIAPITTKSFSKQYPTNVHLHKETSGLKTDSTILLSQIRTIDKQRLEKKIGHLSPSIMAKVEQAIKISLGFE